MSEERIKALEIAQVQFQKDLSSLVVKQTEIFNQQIQLDKTIVSVLAKLDARLEEEIQFTQTLRNLDNSVKSLSLKFERSPLEHNRVVTSATEKLWESLREHELRFQDFKMESHDVHTNLSKTIKTELIGTAKNHIKVLYSCIVLVSLMVSAFYIDMKKDINENSEHLSIHHEQHNGVM